MDNPRSKQSNQQLQPSPPFPTPLHRLPESNRSQRRTAPVARKLARYTVDIAALNEIPFPEQSQAVSASGQITLPGVGVLGPHGHGGGRNNDLLLLLLLPFFFLLLLLLSLLLILLLLLLICAEHRPYPSQHLPPFDAEESNLDAPSIAAPATVGLSSHPEAISIGGATPTAEPTTPSS
nr:unnamed protein product [Spirometra erinaceieuropaei]